jgi:hypothetical protein
MNQQTSNLRLTPLLLWFLRTAPVPLLPAREMGKLCHCLKLKTQDYARMVSYFNVNQHLGQMLNRISFGLIEVLFALLYVACT